MAAAEAAHPDDAARVDDAIRKLASTGVPFSANQARTIHGVKGGVVGARFAAAQTAGLIEPVGSEASTDKGTHGKALTRWIGRRAA